MSDDEFKAAVMARFDSMDARFDRLESKLDDVAGNVDTMMELFGVKKSVAQVRKLRADA